MFVYRVEKKIVAYLSTSAQKVRPIWFDAAGKWAAKKSITDCNHRWGDEGDSLTGAAILSVGVADQRTTTARRLAALTMCRAKTKTVEDASGHKGQRECSTMDIATPRPRQLLGVCMCNRGGLLRLQFHY